MNENPNSALPLWHSGRIPGSLPATGASTIGVIKKGRVGNAKSSKACITCKKRHVKCGEEHPQCQRCIKFGVECDGYREKAKKTRVVKRVLRDLIPKVKTVCPPTMVSSSPFASSDEHRYFELFCTRTSFEILPAFDPGTTRRLLLQLCQQNSSIRHSIIAIGALHKASSLARDFAELSMDTSDRTATASHHHFQALTQYSKAISEIATAIKHEVGIQTMLLTCLLVLCFEAWNGSLQLAINQAQIGIELILDWKSKYGDVESMDLSPAPSVLDPDLIQIFCTLALQINVGGTKLSAKCSALIRAKSQVPLCSMPSEFSTLQEATLYYQDIRRQMANRMACYANSDIKSFLFSNSEVQSRAFEDQEKIQTLIDGWFRACHKLADTMLLGHEIRYLRVLQIQMTTCNIGLVTVIPSGELTHDHHDILYQRVIDLAEEITNESSLPHLLQTTNFSFDTRHILPLWISGLKCRDGSIRRRIIRLLLIRPRREGIWDSTFASQMLIWVMGLEEMHAHQSMVPKWAKVMDFSWDSDMEYRTAVLVCRQRVSEHSKHFVERQESISW